MPSYAVVIPIIVDWKTGLHGDPTGIEQVLGVVRLTNRISCKINQRYTFQWVIIFWSMSPHLVTSSDMSCIPERNWPMYPVCDQGFLIHPSGVELVGAIRAPEPDQNHPAKDRTLAVWKQNARFLSTLLASWALLIVIKFLDPSRNLLRKRKSSNSYALIIRLTDWIQITSDFAVWNREFNFSSTTPKKRRDARQQDIFCFDSSWHWTLNLSRLECSCGQIWY